MVRSRSFPLTLTILALIGVLASCGFHRKKYDNPITKDTQQPDKALFDKSINDIEHGRYEVARITLNTLINTYDQSEYLAKAKLAIADSWYREGGTHGYAEAEAEYKDFILFYPMMEESAEAQNRVCMIHYRQMEKPDRDLTQALRAEAECRQLVVQFPNSKYAPEAEQRLRNIQEEIAEEEFRVGTFYYKKGSNPAAANRLSRLVDQYPLYSKSDEALWDLGDAYSKMGTRFRPRAGEAYSRIIREYPLSPLADEAKKKLNDMELPIPQVDPVALAHMKYEQEHYKKPGMMQEALDVFRHGPDVSSAAKSGSPAMTTINPTVPLSVPNATGTSTGFTADVSAQQVGDSSALDTQPDARLNPPGSARTATTGTAKGATTPAAATPAATTAAQPLPQNHPMDPKELKKLEKQREKKLKKEHKQKQPAATPDTTTSGTASGQAALPSATTDK
ncbi:MAG TPA: outer membrane protein assembly factor BamD [Bryobacteraceae bacterium]|nr:outer membrane protein assembly factor BamD [Bryobacteraceae bacterium]